MRKTQSPQLYGIIGTSLKHTLSPLIYNFLSQKYTVNGAYSVFEIAKGDLAGTIKAVRLLGIKGLNVTYPFKETIIKHLDKLDKSAADIGAVNIIKNVNGVLTGYNTDRFGIEATFLNQVKLPPRNKNILLIGAGGAARACLKALSRFRPKTVMIVNRTSAKAQKIKRLFSDDLGHTDLIVKDINDLSELSGKMKFDIIINATSTNKNSTKILLHQLNKSRLLAETRLFDMNYGTRAISDGLPEGISCQVDGLYMLAAQAARSFQIWHGTKVNLDELYEFLNNRQ